MKTSYTKQNLFHDLSEVFLFLEQTDFSNKKVSEEIFNLIAQSNFFKNAAKVERKFFLKTESLVESLINADTESPTKKEIIKLKTKIIELKNLVQSEIEKEVQSDLFKEVA